jgi:hypothetical protein
MDGVLDRDSIVSDVKATSDSGAQCARAAPYPKAS